MAATNLGVAKVAMTWGTTILLFNCSKEEFLADKNWVLHELRHVLQYKKLGFYQFIYRYLKASIKSGYHNNIYEVSARQHANDIDLLNKVIWV